MKSIRQNPENYAIIIALIIFAVLSRFVPHPVNMTPVGALGLLAGACLLDRRFWLVPIAALVISDFFIGFYEPVSMLFVYLGFICIAFIGRYALTNKLTAVRVGLSAFAATNVFFILSNFGTWLNGTLYPMTFEGLTGCFVAAIPFYGNSLVGDLSYSFLLFGLYALLQQPTARHDSTPA